MSERKNRCQDSTGRGSVLNNGRYTLMTLSRMSDAELTSSALALAMLMAKINSRTRRWGSAKSLALSNIIPRQTDGFRQ